MCADCAGPCAGQACHRVLLPCAPNLLISYAVLQYRYDTVNMCYAARLPLSVSVFLLGKLNIGMIPRGYYTRVD